ncbi:hypothetical protein KY360_06860 [Candidatus Woesearchaeota archaeon]|nr:hypothetical protein [Candidatus Woesearchaeota archaeon]
MANKNRVQGIVLAFFGLLIVLGVLIRSGDLEFAIIYAGVLAVLIIVPVVIIKFLQKKGIIKKP